MDNDTSTNNQPSNITEMLGQLLSKPETIEKIGDIVSRYAKNDNGLSSPPSSENAENNNTAPTNAPTSLKEIRDSSPTNSTSENLDFLKILPAFSSLLSPKNPEISAASNQQKALLLAIRPYLSERRRELIDTFITFNKLSEIFKNLT